MGVDHKSGTLQLLAIDHSSKVSLDHRVFRRAAEFNLPKYKPAAQARDHSLARRAGILFAAARLREAEHCSHSKVFSAAQVMIDAGLSIL